jgi:hypothetical protein
MVMASAFGTEDHGFETPGGVRSLYTTYNAAVLNLEMYCYIRIITDELKAVYVYKKDTVCIQ